MRPLLVAELLRRHEWADTSASGARCLECKALSEGWKGGDPEPGYGKHREGCRWFALLQIADHEASG